MKRFPTAPGWYRLVLQTEVLAFRVAFAGARRRAAAAGLVEQEGGPMNFVYNDLTVRLVGERSLPGEVPGWSMAAHAARYLWAMPRVGDRPVADLGCGFGYGSQLLALASPKVTAVDLSEQAIAEARKRYPIVDYLVADLTDVDELPDAAGAVCFEVLEHVSDPEAIMAAALARYPRVLFSLPNPLWGGSHMNPHHVLDWPLRTCKEKLHAAGAASVNVYSQGRRSTRIVRGGMPWMTTWLFDCVGSGTARAGESAR